MMYLSHLIHSCCLQKPDVNEGAICKLYFCFLLWRLGWLEDGKRLLTFSWTLCKYYQSNLYTQELCNKSKSSPRLAWTAFFNNITVNILYQVSSNQFDPWLCYLFFCIFFHYFSMWCNFIYERNNNSLFLISKLFFGHLWF